MSNVQGGLEFSYKAETEQLVPILMIIKISILSRGTRAKEIARTASTRLCIQIKPFHVLYNNITPGAKFD